MFIAILIKLLARFSGDIDKFIPKCTAKTSLKKKEVGWEGISLPDVKACCIATVVKTVCYWQSDRHTHQWNQVKNPGVDPHKYAQVLLDKGAKAIKWRRDTCPTNGSGEWVAKAWANGAKHGYFVHGHP